MHLHFVPISLSNGKLQFYRESINKVHTEAPERLRALGFDVERGKGKTGMNNIKNIHEYKKNKIKELDNNIHAIKNDLNAIISVFSDVILEKYHMYKEIAHNG